MYTTQLQRNSCRRQNSEATLFCRYFSLYTKSMVMLCFSLNIQHFFYKFISLFMKMSYVFTLRLCLFMIFHGDFLVLYTSQLNWIMFWSAFSVSFLGLFQVGPFSANMWRRVWISWAQGPNNNCILFDVLHIKKKNLLKKTFRNSDWTFGFILSPTLLILYAHTSTHQILIFIRLD